MERQALTWGTSTDRSLPGRLRGLEHELKTLQDAARECMKYIDAKARGFAAGSTVFFFESFERPKRNA